MTFEETVATIRDELARFERALRAHRWQVWRMQQDYRLLAALPPGDRWVIRRDAFLRMAIDEEYGYG